MPSSQRRLAKSDDSSSPLKKGEGIEQRRHSQRTRSLALDKDIVYLPICKAIEEVFDIFQVFYLMFLLSLSRGFKIEHPE